MAIVSVSLNGSVLEEIDRLQKEGGYTGRSEVIRAGVRSLLAEEERLDALSGRIKSVLLLVHSEDAEEAVNGLKHGFEDIIDTQIHTNLKEGKCLEIFVIDGDAKRIKELVSLPLVNKKVEYMKLIVP